MFQVRRLYSTKRVNNFVALSYFRTKLIARIIFKQQQQHNYYQPHLLVDDRSRRNKADEQNTRYLNVNYEHGKI